MCLSYYSHVGANIFRNLGSGCMFVKKDFYSVGDINIKCYYVNNDNNSNANHIENNSHNNNFPNCARNNLNGVSLSRVG